jgi:hypothetical protein
MAWYYPLMSRRKGQRIAISRCSLWRARCEVVR